MPQQQVHHKEYFVRDLSDTDLQERGMQQVT